MDALDSEASITEYIVQLSPDQLRSELLKRSLRTTGDKQALQIRLLNQVLYEKGIDTDNEPSNVMSSTIMPPTPDPTALINQTTPSTLPLTTPGPAPTSTSSSTPATLSSSTVPTTAIDNPILAVASATTASPLLSGSASLSNSIASLGSRFAANTRRLIPFVRSASEAAASRFVNGTASAGLTEAQRSVAMNSAAFSSAAYSQSSGAVKKTYPAFPPVSGTLPAWKPVQPQDKLADYQWPPVSSAPPRSSTLDNPLSAACSRPSAGALVYNTAGYPATGAARTTFNYPDNLLDGLRSPPQHSHVNPASTFTATTALPSIPAFTGAPYSVHSPPAPIAPAQNNLQQYYPPPPHYAPQANIPANTRSNEISLFNMLKKWNVKFNGKREHCEEFLWRLREARTLHPVPDASFFRILPFFLDGIALHWFRNSPQFWHSFDEFATAWEMRFAHIGSAAVIYQEAARRTQGQAEPVADYLTCLQALFNKLPSPLPEEDQIKWAVKNMVPRMKAKLLDTPFFSYHELVMAAISLEQGLRELKDYKPPPAALDTFLPQYAFAEPRDPRYRTTRLAHLETDDDTDPDAQLLLEAERWEQEALENLSLNNLRSATAPLCWNCDATGHRFKDCTSARKIFCFRCGRKATRTADCPKCRGARSAATKPPVKPIAPFCPHCGLVGFTAENCECAKN